MIQRKPTYAELEQKVKALEAKLSAEKIEWAILKLLAAAWDSEGPPGIVDNRELVSRLGITPNEAIPALQKLVENGVIDKDQGGFASYLTTDGYDLVQHGHADTPIIDQIRKIRLAHRGL